MNDVGLFVDELQLDSLGVQLFRSDVDVNSVTCIVHTHSKTHVVSHIKENLNCTVLYPDIRHSKILQSTSVIISKQTKQSLLM